LYSVQIGQGIVRREGKDVTVVAISYMVQEAMKAASFLENESISVEVVDPRTIKPLDLELIFRSVKKTGRAIVADGGWKTCGVAAELSASIAEQIFLFLKAPLKRITLPDVPAPASRVLEEAYYPNHNHIIDAVHTVMGINNKI
jgi:pyruvate/2-oxoglutarate/acetoin dehydrogenase E1 component